MIRCESTGGTYEVRFEADNRYGHAGASTSLPSFGQVRLLAPFSSSQAPLHEIYSEVVTQGRRPAAKAIIKAIIPGFEDIVILVEAGQPVVHIVFEDYSLPIAVMGDGVKALTSLAMGLAARPGGTVLIEEPEVHEHPAAIRQSARAILAATHRDVQVLVSTHSLDFIDALLAECTPEDRAQLAVYRFARTKGVLSTTRIPGDEALLARGHIQDDLR